MNAIVDHCKQECNQEPELWRVKAEHLEQRVQNDRQPVIQGKQPDGSQQLFASVVQEEEEEAEEWLEDEWSLPNQAPVCSIPETPAQKVASVQIDQRRVPLQIHFKTPEVPVMKMSSFKLSQVISCPISLPPIQQVSLVKVTPHLESAELQSLRPQFSKSQ